MNKAPYMRRQHFAIIAFLTSCTINICLAVNYYVATNGNDTGNDGTSVTSAWRTVNWAVSHCSNNAVINIGQGVFTEYPFEITNSITLAGQDLYTPGNAPLQRHSSQTIIEFDPYLQPNTASVIQVLCDHVALSNITIDAKMSPKAMSLLYSRNGGMTVKYCSFKNLDHTQGAYGIAVVGTNGIPVPDDLYNYFHYNYFENIINTNASGIFLQYAPSSVAYNDFTTITDTYAQAAIQMNECTLSNGSPLTLSIDSNYIANCTQGIWAQDFADPTNKIYIRDNTITNCLVGIRVTSADGQAIISGNKIYVGGISETTNSTPARGVWIQADTDPWVTAPTDHQILDNQITDISTNGGTVGVLLEYDDSRGTNGNNGVVATVLNNSVSDFDLGLYVEAGTNGVTNTNSPLVSVTAVGNDIINSGTWAVLAEGMTNDVVATNNWFGVYGDPTGVISGNVYYSNFVQTGSLLLDTDGDGTNDFSDLDDDNDGLLDTTEVSIVTSSPILPDTDFDRQTDYEEYNITGTDPLDPKSVFKISSFTNDTSTTIRWLSVTNRLYSLYRTTNITAGFGAPLQDNIIPSSSGTSLWSDVTATNAPQYFYQVRVRK